jgi:hypothetical protein
VSLNENAVNTYNSFTRVWVFIAPYFIATAICLGPFPLPSAIKSVQVLVELTMFTIIQ